MSIYQYSQKDAFEHPQSYMYTEYEGESLLKAYRADRRKHFLNLTGRSIDSEEVKNLALEPDLFISSHIIKLPVKDCHSDNFVLQTQEVLDAVVGIFYAEASREKSLAIIWLKKFQQKFEVSKKLYRSYTSNLKPQSQDFHDLAIYISFGAALALACRIEERMQLNFLNSLLKVNDLLLSQRLSDASEPTLCLRISRLILIEKKLIDDLDGLIKWDRRKC